MTKKLRLNKDDMGIMTYFELYLERYGEEKTRKFKKKVASMYVRNHTFESSPKAKEWKEWQKTSKVHLWVADEEGKMEYYRWLNMMIEEGFIPTEFFN